MRDQGARWLILLFSCSPSFFTKVRLFFPLRYTFWENLFTPTLPWQIIQRDLTSFNAAKRDQRSLIQFFKICLMPYHCVSLIHAVPHQKLWTNKIEFKALIIKLAVTLTPLNSDVLQFEFWSHVDMYFWSIKTQNSTLLRLQNFQIMFLTKIKFSIVLAPHQVTFLKRAIILICVEL